MVLGLQEEEDGEENESFRTRNRKRIEFHVNDRVEVFSVEEGFQGSWHPGTVVLTYRNDWQLGYRVKYDHLLVDDGSCHLVDDLHVSVLVDDNDHASGNLCNNHGRIRPSQSCAHSCILGLCYGRCVDVYYNECWWEGVVFDHEEGSEKRNIFFPELGDEVLVPIDAIRITQDWNDVTGAWQIRGTWLFLELIEEYERDNYIPVSIKQLWFDLREKDDFKKLGEWTSNKKELWRSLVLEAISDNLNVLIHHIFQAIGLSEDVKEQVKSPTSLYHESNLSCHKKAVSEVPQFSMLLPSNQDDASVTTSATGEDISSSSDASDGMYFGFVCRKSSWQPVGPDMVPGAEFCPNAVVKYAQMYKRKAQDSLIIDCRKHLSHLNWKIEYSRDPTIRFRYTSPVGEQYYSLHKVCSILAKSYEGIISSVHQDGDINLFNVSGNSPSHLIKQTPDNQDSVIDFHSEIHFVKPEYCPEAPAQWYKFGYQEKLGSKRREQMILKAKQHLSALGWRFRYICRQGRRELRYISPTGRYYNSLRVACRDCGNGIASGASASTSAHPERKTFSKIVEGQSDLNKIWLLNRENCPTEYACMSEFKNSSVLQNLEVGETRKFKKKKKELLESCCLQQDTKAFSQNFLSISKVRNRRKTRGLMKLKDHWPNRVLRSSKRVQQAMVPNPSHQKPLTVLSWLIDNTDVLPRAKITYCRGKCPIAEGRISGGGSGIKCNCCGKVYTLSGFEYHVNGKCGRPAASIFSNIFLEDGRSLLDCQKQMVHDISRNIGADPLERLQASRHQGENDHICSICHYGGELILCDQCPSSFHQSCLGMVDVPDGDWFCSSCCCKICGQNKLKRDSEHSMVDEGVLDCTQCERKYHVGCLRNKGEKNLKNFCKENWFCSKSCEQIFLGLHEILGKPIPVGFNNLTWTLLKFSHSSDHICDDSNIEALSEYYSKLRIALDIIHECFEPVEEPQTERDLVKDVIFSKRSELNRLNFQGFYTILLQKEDEFITVATVRVYQEVAEIPLVGTRFRYRRLGMCRMLMNVLEKKLRELGVQRLILPAVPSILNTWTGSFGFSQLTDSERLQLLDYNFLDFQGTVMCHKLLTKIPSIVSSPSTEIQPRLDIDASGNVDNIDGSSAVSEVIQADQIVGQIVEHGMLGVSTIGSSTGSERPINPAVMVNSGTDVEFELQAGEISLEFSDEDSFSNKEKGENGDVSKTFNVESRYDTLEELKCYKRRRVLACGS